MREAKNSEHNWGSVARLVGMGNTCELSLNVVNCDKPNVLTGLNQNGT